MSKAVGRHVAWWIQVVYLEIAEVRFLWFLKDFQGMHPFEFPTWTMTRQRGQSMASLQAFEGSIVDDFGVCAAADWPAALFMEPSNICYANQQTCVFNENWMKFMERTISSPTGSSPTGYPLNHPATAAARNSKLTMVLGHALAGLGSWCCLWHTIDRGVRGNGVISKLRVSEASYYWLLYLYVTYALCVYAKAWKW